MIPLFSVNMPKSVDEPLLKALHSGYITQGPQVEKFEQILRKYFKTNALTVNSGTSAITLALRLANVGFLDNVITTPMTCTATNLPILSLGAEPKFANINQETGNIDPKSVEALIDEKTKAIMAVDWGGTPADYVYLKKIANDHNIKLIIDSAHSFGASHTIDPIADFVCFSLQAIKHMTTVDGGVLLVKNDNDFVRGKKLRWFGISRDSASLDSRIAEDIEEWGYKFHMNDITATIGIEQMKHIKSTIYNHRFIAALYNDQIDDFYGKPISGYGAFWLYTLRLPTRDMRDQFKEFMNSVGITVSQVHKRNDYYSVFKSYESVGYGQDSNVSRFADRMICIPIHNALSPHDIYEIIEKCNYFARIHK